MSGPGQKLREAGFKDNEILDELSGERKKLEDAGFSQDEIVQELVGAPEPQVPNSLMGRFREGTAMGRMLGSIQKGMEEGFGKEPVIRITPEDHDKLAKAGIFRSPEQTGLAESAFSGIRLANEALFYRGAALADVAARSLGALTGIIGGPTSQAAGEAKRLATGKPEEPEQAEKRTAEFNEAINIAALVTGMSHISRPSRTPGAPDEHIGGFPKANDIADAPRAIVAEDSPELQSKVQRLWDDHAIHPAEIVADAHRDPVLAADLLSENKELPKQYTEVYHGSPHEFEVFDKGKIGTGEGAAAYGHGLYFAENPKVAEEYSKSLADKDFIKKARDLYDEGYSPEEAHQAIAESKDFTPPQKELLGALEQDDWLGFSYPHQAVSAALREPEAFDLSPRTQKALDSVRNLYTVRLNANTDLFLDWHKRLDEQHAEVQKAVAAAAGELKDPGLFTFEPERTLREARKETLAATNSTGEELYRTIARALSDGKGFDKAAASELLSKHGIQGIKYFDKGSRTAGDGTRNFVVFDDKDVEITHKNGEPVTAEERKAFVDDRVPEAQPPAVGGGGKPPGEPPGGDVIPPEDIGPGGPMKDITPPKSEGLPKPPMTLDEAERLISDKISVGEPSKRPMTASQIYTSLVDDLHPIKSLSPDAYEAARLTRGSGGRAKHFIEHGTFDFHDPFKKTGKGMREILEPVSGKFDDLRNYMAAKHALEIEAQGKVSGFDPGAAQVVVDHVEGKPTRVLAEGGDTKIITGGSPELQRAAEELVDYQNRVTKYLKDSGVLSEAGHNAMMELNKAYVPFYRLMEDWKQPSGQKGPRFGPGNPVKRLIGSEREVIDPLESVIKNTYAYVSIADRNEVGLKIIDALEKTGPEYSRGLIPWDAVGKPEKLLTYEKVARGDDHEVVQYLEHHGVKPNDDLVALITSDWSEREGNAITAFRNGERIRAVTTDVDLFNAWRSLDRQTSNALWQFLSIPAKTLRAGATLTPEFVARNIFTDFLTAFVNTKGGIFNPIDTYRGARAAFTKNEDFQKWLRSGGANSELVGMDRQYLQESLQLLDKETGLMSRGWNVLTHPTQMLLPLQKLSAGVEQATRIGEFMKVLGEQESKEAVRSAGYTSREVTVDFSRSGSALQSFSLITAFQRAQIQGVDRAIRAFKDNPVSTSLKVFAGITLPSMALWAINKDDPDYRQLPPWVRDLYWNIPYGKDDLGHTKFFRLRKPFELGVIFGSGPERVLDAYFEKNDDAFKKFSGSVIGVLTPTLVPTFSGPVVEQLANTNLYTGQPLVPTRMQNHLPEYQYTPYTTELSKELGHIIGAFPGMREAGLDKDSWLIGGTARALTSPILRDNFLRAWTGGLGDYMVKATDVALRKAGVLPDPPKPSDTLADIPFVKAFAVRYPSAGAQSIQDFYEEYERRKSYSDTFNRLVKEEPEEARKLLASNPKEITTFKEYAREHKMLGDTSKIVRDLYRNPQQKPEEKRQLIDQMYFRMIEVAKGATQRMKKEIP